MNVQVDNKRQSISVIELGSRKYDKVVRKAACESPCCRTAIVRRTVLSKAIYAF